MKYTAKKIRRGLYRYRGLYLVSTERLNDKDKRLDWLAVESLEAAVKIYHGNKPGEYVHVHNTLRDLKRYIDRTPVTGKQIAIERTELERV